MGIGLNSGKLSGVAAKHQTFCNAIKTTTTITGFLFNPTTFAFYTAQFQFNFAPCHHLTLFRR